MQIEDLDRKQKNISNADVDWSKHYDYFEIEMRNMYKTVAKPQNDSHFEMLKHHARNYLSSGKIFCEIGFGAGLTLRTAMKYFKKVYGLDISPKNVEFTKNELAEEGYKNFEIHLTDLMIHDERFKDKFDVISLIHGLEHFTKDDYSKILTNIKSYLKADGIFTGALPFKNVFNYRMCPHCSGLFEIDGHVSSHDINSLSSVFNGHGFEISYINDFNVHYALSDGNALQKFHRLALYKLFKRKFFTQLEYIVKPVK